MALNVPRLTDKIKQAFKTEQTEELSADAALDRISEKLAQAFIDEIKQAGITYSSGLIAPNGAVTGTFNHTIT